MFREGPFTLLLSLSCFSAILSLASSTPIHDTGSICDVSFVCGTDGKTYLNSFQAMAAGVDVDCEYECPCGELPPCAFSPLEVPPCQRYDCPAFPTAQCYRGGICGKSAIFVFACTIVNCDVPSFSSWDVDSSPLRL